MRLLILRSVPVDKDHPGPDRDYLQAFNTRYAERVIGSLRNDISFCSACGPDCSFCRKTRVPDCADDLVAVIDFPAVQSYLLETPGDCVPQDVPDHDVLLAINIHEQVLLEMLRGCEAWGTKGVVVPLEAPDWVSGATRAEAERVCQARGVELAFPKPFCAFDPPAGSFLAEFRDYFRIGMPDVELTVEKGRISEARVKVSAACGATYYIARWLEGKSLEDDLEFEVVGKRLHSYPCTASMEWDDELGETCLHVAGEAHKKILSGIKDVTDEGSGLVMSPLGIMVQKPVPPRENIENIEKAKEEILARLKETGSLTLTEARKLKGTTPAAVSSALLVLKRQGRIRVEDGRVTPAG